MTSEQADRMLVGWSREQLARASGVSVAAVYLLERMGTAGLEDDAQIRNVLAQRRSEHTRRNNRPAANDPGFPQNDQRAVDTGSGH